MARYLTREPSDNEDVIFWFHLKMRALTLDNRVQLYCQIFEQFPPLGAIVPKIEYTARVEPIFVWFWSRAPFWVLISLREFIRFEPELPMYSISRSDYAGTHRCCGLMIDNVTFRCFCDCCCN